MADLAVFIGSILILLVVWTGMFVFAYRRSPSWTLARREKRIRKRHRG